MSYLKIILALIFVLGVIAFPIIFIPKALNTNEVSCISQYGPCNQNITNQIKRAEKMKLGQALRQINEQLSASHLLSDYSIQFKFPDRLEARILERKPRYALKSSNLPWVALIEKDGQVIAILENSNLYLPSVKIDGQLPNVGEEVDEKILFALSIIYDVYSTHSVPRGEIKDDRLRVEFSPKLAVIFPLEGEKDVLVGSLAAILSRLNADSEGFRIDETPVSVIDLRFKNPVLR